jgi:hypothetical protein
MDSKGLWWRYTRDDTIIHGLILVKQRVFLVSVWNRDRMNASGSFAWSMEYWEVIMICEWYVNGFFVAVVLRWILQRIFPDTTDSPVVEIGG